MMVIVLMIVLYFLVQLLGTMLPQRTGILPLILVCVMIVISCKRFFSSDFDHYIFTCCPAVSWSYYGLPFLLWVLITNTQSSINLLHVQFHIHSRNWVIVITTRHRLQGCLFRPSVMIIYTLFSEGWSDFCCCCILSSVY